MSDKYAECTKIFNDGAKSANGVAATFYVLEACFNIVKLHIYASFFTAELTAVC